MTIKAVLFDKDGTLIDFNATFEFATRYVLEQMFPSDTASMEQAADRLGFDLKTDRISNDSIIIAGSGIEIAKTIAPLVGQTDLELVSGQISMFYGAACLESLEAIPQTETCLKELQTSGILMGIGTNDDEVNARQQMDALNLTSHFQHILGADSGYGAKPHPGMVQAFCAKVEAEPHQVMMVGDSTHDLQAGKAAGVVTCGVETGPATASELKPFADFVLPSVGDLPALIDDLMQV